MKEKFIITIGRQFGSGGLEVARRLGRKLGIPVYDSELISKAAQDSGFSAEFFEQNDEKGPGFTFRSIFSGDSCIDSEELFRIQGETIRDIAENGPAIIVGRCSDYILRDCGKKLDVFLTSPLEARVDRVVERMRISAEKAKELIARKDRKRAEYYNHYTLGDWGIADNYDLCIDSSILGIDATADMIIEFARKARFLE